VQDVDLAPFDAVARLLYEGPWVAERRAAVGAFYDAHADRIEPTVRGILAGADRFSARDAFEGRYRLAALRRECGDILAQVDALLLPTAPTIYRTDEVLAEPLLLNARLGVYTNFVNLLDLAAVAVPFSMRDDGLPFGVTFVAPAWTERALLELAARWQRAAGLPLGATGAALPAAADPAPSGVAPDRVRVAVVGAHLSGMPLNHQLTGRDAVLAGTARTAQRYRLFALAGTVPAKPGLLRVADGDGGASIELELWDIPLSQFGSFVAEVAAPLSIGSLQLDDGTWVKGFVCEAHAVGGARDISSYGGWRAWLRAQPS
jgi:allophanate hydrolase